MYLQNPEQVLVGGACLKVRGWGLRDFTVGRVFALDTAYQGLTLGTKYSSLNPAQSNPQASE